MRERLPLSLRRAVYNVHKKGVKGSRCKPVRTSETLFTFANGGFGPSFGKSQKFLRMEPYRCVTTPRNQLLEPILPHRRAGLSRLLQV